MNGAFFVRSCDRLCTNLSKDLKHVKIKIYVMTLAEMEDICAGSVVLVSFYFVWPKIVYFVSKSIVHLRWAIIGSIINRVNIHPILAFYDIFPWQLCVSRVARAVINHVNRLVYCYSRNQLPE